jgi:hypothetical protein
MLANEMSITGRTEAEVYAFVDKIINAMVATVKSGLRALYPPAPRALSGVFLGAVHRGERSAM